MKPFRHIGKQAPAWDPAEHAGQTMNANRVMHPKTKPFIAAAGRIGCFKNACRDLVRSYTVFIGWCWR